MKEISIPNYRIFSSILISFLVGVFCSSFFRTDFLQIYGYSIFILLLVFGIYFIFGRKFSHRVLLLATIGFISGWLIFSYQNTKIDNFSLPLDQEINFDAKINSYPETDGNYSSFYIIASGTDDSILVKTARYPENFYGEELKLSGKIEKIKNYSDFDYQSYQKRYGTIAEIKNPKIEKTGKTTGNRFLLSLYKVKSAFQNAVRKSLPEPESSLASGLLVGTKEGFSDSLLANFSKTGITHIIALSGYNVTIIIIFLTDLMLGVVERRKIFLISTVLVSLFVAMTGAAPSIIRAAIITLLIAYGKTIGRRADMVNLILLSAVVMVAINPFILRFDLGFQLSFLAFLGLVYFSPVMEHFLNKKWLRRVPKDIRKTLGETLSAQIFVLPLILISFGVISVISPLANILILPIIPAVMFTIFAATLIYFISPAVGHLAFLITFPPLKYVIALTNYLAALPISAVTIQDQWRVIISMIYIILVAILIFVNRKVYAKEVS